MLRRLCRFIARLLGRPRHKHSWVAAELMGVLPHGEGWLKDWVCLDCGATNMERQDRIERLAREARERELATAIVRAYIDERGEP